MKKKAWVVFALVLLIGIQLSSFSQFHEIKATTGFAHGNTAICIAKWNYVQANVRVIISTHSSPANFTLIPEGTKGFVSSWTNYNITLNLPRTGDFFYRGEFYATGPVNLTESSPIVWTIEADTSSVPFPFQNTCSQLEGQQNIDVAMIMVTGNDAFVTLSGYGVAL